MSLENINFRTQKRALTVLGAAGLMGLAAACGGGGENKNCDNSITGPGCTAQQSNDCCNTANPSVHFDSVAVTPDSLGNGQIFEIHASGRASAGTGTAGAKELTATYEGLTQKITNPVVGQVYKLQFTAKNLVPGTVEVDPVNLQINASGNRMADTTVYVKVSNTPQIIAPTARDTVLVAGKEGDGAQSVDLSVLTAGQDRLYRIVSATPGFTANVTGSNLTLAPNNSDVNGSAEAIAEVYNAAGASQIKVTKNFAPQIDFESEVLEQRTQSRVTSAYQQEIINTTTGQSYVLQATNGVVKGQLGDAGDYTIKLGTNGETFKVERYEKSDGSLLGAGVNYVGNETITVNLQNDHIGRTIRLGATGTSVEQLNETTLPAHRNIFGENHVVPSYSNARIRVLNAANADYSCVAPDATTLTRLIEGANKVKAHYGASDFNIVVEVASDAPFPLPLGTQVACASNTNFNGILKDSNGNIVGGVARVRNGASATTVLAELSDLYAGLENEYNLTTIPGFVTFYSDPKPVGVTDLVSWDHDVDNNLVQPFARIADRKQQAYGGSKFRLER
jgi:hypothetical protein